jgi:hypothetical protein
VRFKCKPTRRLGKRWARAAASAAALPPTIRLVVDRIP